MVKKVKDSTEADKVDMLISDKMNTNLIEAYDSSALGYSNESTL